MVGKFGKHIAIYLGTVRYETGLYLLENTDRKSQVADLFVSVLMTLSDRERQGMRDQNFQADHHNY